MLDSPSKKEACGLFAVHGVDDTAKLIYLGLYALQHRGQESAGIVVSDGHSLTSAIGMGLVSDVFKERVLKSMGGSMGIGHVRYSTTGSSLLRNAQPFLVEQIERTFALGHNGNIVNVASWRRQLESKGAIFQTSTDSELIAHLILQKDGSLEERLLQVFDDIKGAFSLVLMTPDRIIGARDPLGFRPLCIGRKGDAFVFASETCALDIIEAEYVRDVEPGEVVTVDNNGLRSLKAAPGPRRAMCIFEYIYFARPDSMIFGHGVYQVRKALGRRQAREAPVEGADMVIPMPASGNYAALGFAQESGLPFEFGFIRNHYVGRTFIQPSPAIRSLGVRVKLNPVSQIIRGKRIVVVDDSIVRGTTSKLRTRTLREAGAKEIHMRISCPPIRYPCFYGIDFSSKGELIACSTKVENICQFIGADSLAYLGLEGMLSAMPLPTQDFCTACFTGHYPEEVPEDFHKTCLECRNHDALQWP